MTAYPTNPGYYTAPRPNYLPCSVEQAAGLNLVTLRDRCNDETWAIHRAYLLTLKDNKAEILAYCVQELTSIDEADTRQMYRDLCEGRY